MGEPNLITRGLKRVLGNFLTPVTIVRVEPLSKHFRLIEIRSEALKQANWQPGSKIQVDLGNLQFRTYTPIKIDSGAGSLTFLAYRREGHPATEWIDGLKIGDAAEIFGPRSSLDLSQYEGNTLLFGDETSIGAAKVLKGQNPDARIFLEVNSLEETQAVLTLLQLDHCIPVQRTPGESHLEKLVESIVAANAKQTFNTAILTGRMRSIQTMRKLLKSDKSVSAKVVLRAYWADGKKGLD